MCWFFVWFVKNMFRISVSEIFALQDCYRYDTASSNKTSSYASPIVYRGGGSGQWNYSTTNGYYGTISGSNEVMIPLTELTGKNNFIIEYDAKLNSNDTNRGISGICAYENNNNYSRISCNALKLGERVSVNGTATESESNTQVSVSTGDLLHYKFTVTNNQIVEEVTKGTSTVGTKTISYTPTANTIFGFALVWSNTWTKDTFLKNIKIKAL